MAIRATFISGPFLFERLVVTAVTTDASPREGPADAADDRLLGGAGDDCESPEQSGAVGGYDSQRRWNPAAEKVMKAMAQPART
ncbi:hypothetical protein ACWEOZ_02310 [Actinoplanes sp. NPDC004185]